MIKRLYFNDIKKELDKPQICLLIGARQVGKTTLIRQLHNELKHREKEVAFISLENKQYRMLLDETPENIFQLVPPLNKQSRLYLFIDEIQYLKDPSNFLKHIYDDYREQVKFIVTGSSSFYIDRKFNDSLAGRKRIIEIPPLSLKEIFLFKDRKELIPYINNGPIPLIYQAEILNLFYEYLVYGGYPDVVLANGSKEKILILKELSDSYVKKDTIEADVKKPKSYLHLLKLLAERSGSLINTNSLANDVGVSTKTIESYLWILQKSFHIHTINPFHKNISTELKKMNKIYLNDLGLRNYLVSNFSPIGLREDRGTILENYAYNLFRENLIVDNIRFWRTQKKQEVDFIISDLGGNSEAIEVKFNKDNFKVSKYNFFKERYPKIPLRCLDIKSVLEYEFTGSAAKK